MTRGWLLAALGLALVAVAFSTSDQSKAQKRAEARKEMAEGLEEWMEERESKASDATEIARIEDERKKLATRLDNWILAKEQSNNETSSSEELEEDDAEYDSEADKAAADEKELQEAKARGSRIGGLKEFRDRHGLADQKDFDYLMFTAIYPTATCMADDDQVPGSCAVPTGAAEWTIHGLWPNYNGGKYPQFCDPSHFDPAQVAEIKAKMLTSWPNLFPKAAETSLWRHEWEKHGTCSKSDPLLDSQLKYFNSALSLLDVFQIPAKLAAAGIKHDAKEALHKDVFTTALNKAVGKTAQFNCLRDKKTGLDLLADIRICVDRELRPIDCPQAEPESVATNGRHHGAQPLPVPKSCQRYFYYVPVGAEIDVDAEDATPHIGLEDAIELRAKIAEYLAKQKEAVAEVKKESTKKDVRPFWRDCGDRALHYASRPALIVTMGVLVFFLVIMVTVLYQGIARPRNYHAL